MLLSPYQSATFTHKFQFNFYKEHYKYLSEETLGYRIKKGRLSANMSWPELGRKIGGKASTIYDYEFNYAHPSSKVIRKLAELFSPEEICGDDEYLLFIVSDYPGAIRSWREKQNYSYRDAAKILGTHYTNFEYWEKGEFTPSRKSFEIIKARIT